MLPFPIMRQSSSARFKPAWVNWGQAQAQKRFWRALMSSWGRERAIDQEEEEVEAWERRKQRILHVWAPGSEQSVGQVQAGAPFNVTAASPFPSFGDPENPYYPPEQQRAIAQPPVAQLSGMPSGLPCSRACPPVSIGESLESLDLRVAHSDLAGIGREPLHGDSEARLGGFLGMQLWDELVWLET